MRKIIGFLIPWRGTFRRLELEKRWGHRLSVVVFILVLIPTFLFSWGFGYDADEPANTFGQDIHHWEPAAGAPNGLLFDVDSEQSLDSAPQSAQTSAPVIVQKTVEMPDGKTATYPGTTSDDTIKAEWQHKLNLAQAQAALFGFGIAVLVSLIFSYLLQAIYRAALYVIYGAKAGADSAVPNATSDTL